MYGKVDDKWPKIAFQLFIYDMMLRQDGRKGEISNSIYQTASLFKEKPATYPMSEEVYAEMERGLEEKLREIEDLSVPFRRTDDPDVCKWCDFKMICGR